ncbi:hypothetical protein EU805_01645 [Salipiger sp. IMCC34102]|uniref:hypothetical protein n=1 Tax=Salipiger sp. IMCC34102 TaxID=2510647 RepID=UPI00101BBD91|nr:hypothetical protein [Salipiger sp. IMCC34102]RYH04101.1 hypothetical protein EU805_01645 [Salipiger sp. IMCC34102]
MSSTTTEPGKARACRNPLAKITADQLRPLWEGKISTDKIGAAFGVTGQAVRGKAKRLGLGKRSGRSRQFMSDEEFTRLWMAGVRSKDISRLGGYTHKNAVYRRRIILGLPPRTRGTETSRARTGGWKETITLEEYREQQLGEAMAAAARSSK